MVEAVNTDQYAKATGQMLDSYLSASHPLREVLEKSMVHALQHLNMPSSTDVTALAERVTNIEMRLDDMDAKLDRIVKQLLAGRAGEAEGRRRENQTRQEHKAWLRRQRPTPSRPLTRRPGD